MSDDEIRVYPLGEHPLERPYVESLRLALPDWTIKKGPFCPGKAGHLTYVLVKEGEEDLMAHVRDGDYAVFPDYKGQAWSRHLKSCEVCKKAVRTGRMTGMKPAEIFQMCYKRCQDGGLLYKWFIQEIEITQGLVT